MAKALWIKQRRSKCQVPERQRLTLKALGLRGVGSEIVRSDTRALRGMCNKVQHLLEVKQVDPVSSKLITRPKTSQRGFKFN